MNKKEIIQQFAKQMLEPDREDYQARLTELHNEIGALTQSVRNITNSYDMKLIHSSIARVNTDLKEMIALGEVLNNSMLETKAGIRRLQKVSIWKRYWTAIWVGAIAAIITNLILIVWFLANT